MNMEYFEQFDTLLRTFWYIALPSSLIFIVQTIMTFVGADATDGIDADFDSNLEGTDAPFQLFSLRNLINFLLGFSWTGISLWESIANKNVLIAVSTGVGILFLVLFFFIIQQVQKLAENNTFKLTNCLNKNAEVYLTIPSEKSGMGKVTLSVNGSYKNLSAITLGESIPTGAIVKITGIEGDNLLVVENIKN